MTARRIIKVRIPDDDPEEPEYGDDSTPTALFLTFAAVGNIPLILPIISMISEALNGRLLVEFILFWAIFSAISLLVWGGGGVLCYGITHQAVAINTTGSWGF